MNCFLVKLIFLTSSMSTSMAGRVAVVTGSNKGIGYAIVKALCGKFKGDVYLTARSEERGLAAVKSLNESGFHPKFHLLDITIPESVEKLRDHMMEHYGGIDVLVNNAAIAFKSHARVVNLSSFGGHLSQIFGQNLRDILASSDLTEEKLSTLMTSFVESAKNFSHVEKGWPHWAYGVSKVGVSALSRIQQRELSEDANRPDIVVNHVHPGLVDTDMSSHKGKLSPDQGAEAPVFLALLPENCSSPKGDFVWSNKQIVDWINGPLPED